MEPDSLSFPAIINKVQSYLVWGRIRSYQKSHCKFFKQETMKRHSKSFTHIRSCDSFMAKRKEELPCKKLPKLLNLQRKNGFQIGEMYSTDRKCTEIVSTIIKVYQNKLAKTVNKNFKYMCILIDGGEDAGGENETIQCRLVEYGQLVNHLVGHKSI